MQHSIQVKEPAATGAGYVSTATGGWRQQVIVRTAEGTLEARSALLSSSSSSSTDTTTSSTTTAPTSSRAYALNRVLVLDKADVTILHGSVLQLDDEESAPGTSTWKLSDEPDVVVKAVRLASRAGEQAEHELKVVRQLPRDNTHVATLIDALRDDLYVYLIYPYHCGGDLTDVVLRSDSPMTEREARGCFVQVVEALVFLKDRNIAHNDVTLENIVLSPPNTALNPTKDPRAWLIDLGRSKRVHTHLRTHVRLVEAAAAARANAGQSKNHNTRAGANNNNSNLGDGGGGGREAGGATVGQNGHSNTPRRLEAKPGYIDPQFASAVGYLPTPHANNNTQISTHTDVYASDVWALGVCLYILLTGKPLYSGPSDPAFTLLALGHTDVLLNHYASLLGPTHALSTSAHDLLCGMLRAKTEDRMTLEDVLAHTWIKGGKEGEEGGEGDEEEGEPMAEGS